VLDHLEKDVVDWEKVEMKPNNKFKMISNCNYFLACATKLRLHTLGIGGPDIYDGNRNLILAILWQVMRYHLFKALHISKKSGSPDVQLNDQSIINWANSHVESKVHPFLSQHNNKFASTGTVHQIKSFRDPTLKNSLFLLNLIWTISPKTVNWNEVTHGDTDEQKLSNARYAISLARKLGAVIFLSPEDIAEVKWKMVMAFLAALMIFDLSREQ